MNRSALLGEVNLDFAPVHLSTRVEAKTLSGALELAQSDAARFFGDAGEFQIVGVEAERSLTGIAGVGILEVKVDFLGGVIV